MHDAHPADGTAAPGPPHPMVLASIGGFWALYGTIVTLRSAVLGHGDQLDMFARRLVILAFSMAITYLLYLLLRRTPTASLRRTIIAAACLSVPASIAFSVVSWVAFDVVAQPAKAAPAPTANNATPGRTMVQVGGTSADDADMAPIKMIADSAVNSYFFFAAWAALYLALCYATEVGALERKAAALRTAAQTAELRALRYQVNPHFLFNTFNALSSLVMTGQRDIAERMIINLSSFFRASLIGDPSDDVRLEEEVRLQQLYLDIEQVRFPTRLRTNIVLPDPLRDVMVPGLILQPLVENAVKHGVARSRRPVLVTIEAAERDGQLALMVRDDGDANQAHAAESGTGLGLRNVRDRIAARFGGAGGCEVRSGPAGGFQVVVTFPLSPERS